MIDLERLRELASKAWRVSECHLPQDCEELSVCVDWIVKDAEDECEMLGGIYSAAAEAALAKEQR